MPAKFRLNKIINFTITSSPHFVNLSALTNLSIKETTILKSYIIESKYILINKALQGNYFAYNILFEDKKATPVVDSKGIIHYENKVIRYINFHVPSKSKIYKEDSKVILNIELEKRAEYFLPWLNTLISNPDSKILARSIYSPDKSKILLIIMNDKESYSKIKENRLNINSATSSELSKLLLLSNSLADKIIESKPYNNIEELNQRNMVPKEEYEIIKNFIFTDTNVINP